MRCASGYSEALEDSQAAGAEAVQMALRSLPGEGPGVVILFSSIAFDLPEVVRGIRSVTELPIIGCTTFSEATESGYRDDSLALFVIRGPGLHFGFGLGENLAADVSAAVARAWQEAQSSLGVTSARLCITFPDSSLSHSGEAVVDALWSVSGGKVPIAGGSPADGGHFKKTFQVLNDRVVSDSIPILLIGGAIEPQVVTCNGWQPMGQTGVVTHAEQNRLCTVDGKPAIAFVQRYIGPSIDPIVLGAHPLALIDDSVEHDGRSHYVMRSPFFYDGATDSIIYGGPIRTGCQVKIGRSSREFTLRSVEEATSVLRARHPARTPRGVLFMSCGARKLLLGLDADKEIQALRSGIGGAVPIAGFYCYGEFGPFNSDEPALARLRFHNTTIVAIGLYEREPPSVHGAS
jgi:hypothetical protein